MIVSSRDLTAKQVEQRSSSSTDNGNEQHSITEFAYEVKIHRAV